MCLGIDPQERPKRGASKGSLAADKTAYSGTTSGAVFTSTRCWRFNKQDCACDFINRPATVSQHLRLLYLALRTHSFYLSLHIGH